VAQTTPKVTEHLSWKNTGFISKTPAPFHIAIPCGQRASHCNPKRGER